MLYKIFLFPARVIIYLYCRQIRINNKGFLQNGGPLLIASNHPNSFLDAIILATLFKNPVYSLARGDVFHGKMITKILTEFNMLPIYRISEGAENLDSNYSTFDACRKIFQKGGIVLIFSEGACVNEWHLRPLKKGTARLALSAWQQDIPLQILPLGINYSSFRSFGKILLLNFGNIINKKDINTGASQGRAIIDFNDKLQEQLQDLVFEIDPTDVEKRRKYFYYSRTTVKQAMLFLPAMAAYLVHFPLYYLIDMSIKRKALDHYDSIMTGLLFFIYPFYIIAITLLVFFLTHYGISFSLLFLIPASVLCLWHYKDPVK